MTIPGSDSSVWATLRDPASEDVNTQGQGANPQRGDGPTLSRRSLLLQASLLALYVVTVPGPAAALGLPRKSLPEATVQQMKRKAQRDVKAVRDQLNRYLPEVAKQVFKNVNVLDGVGLSVGLVSSVLAAFGSVAGLSAAGISSGLAAIGGPVASVLMALKVATVSPMVAGVSVFTGVGALSGYGIANMMTWMKNREEKPVMKLEEAIEKLKTIEARLKPTRYFRSEIAEIKTYIKELKLERQNIS